MNDARQTIWHQGYERALKTITSLRNHSDFKYENVEKIGISYRKFNNIIISLVVKRPKQISFYSVPIDYILVTNDSINFGTFRTQIKYLIDIIHEICEKVFKQIIQIT